MLAAVLPAATLLFLFSYCYLGAAAGSPLFRFLLETTLGNVVLGLAAACYAYHIVKGYISPTHASGEPGLLEELDSVLLSLSMAVAFYPVFRCLLGAPGNRLAPALLSLAASAPIALLTGGRGGRLVRIAGYSSAVLVASAALSSADRLAESFAELAKLISDIEMLARELGVA